MIYVLKFTKIPQMVQLTIIWYHFFNFFHRFLFTYEMTLKTFLFTVWFRLFSCCLVEQKKFGFKWQFDRFFIENMTVYNKFDNKASINMHTQTHAHSIRCLVIRITMYVYCWSLLILLLGKLSKKLAIDDLLICFVDWGFGTTIH